PTRTPDGGRDPRELTRVSSPHFGRLGPTCCADATLSGSVASIAHLPRARTCAFGGLHMVLDLPPLWAALRRSGRQCVRELDCSRPQRMAGGIQRMAVSGLGFERSIDSNTYSPVAGRDRGASDRNSRSARPAEG